MGPDSLFKATSRQKKETDLTHLGPSEIRTSTPVEKVWSISGADPNCPATTRLATTSIEPEKDFCL